MWCTGRDGAWWWDTPTEASRCLCEARGRRSWEPFELLAAPTHRCLGCSISVCEQLAVGAGRRSHSPVSGLLDAGVLVRGSLSLLISAERAHAHAENYQDKGIAKVWHAEQRISVGIAVRLGGRGGKVQPGTALRLRKTGQRPGPKQARCKTIPLCFWGFSERFFSFPQPKPKSR